MILLSATVQGHRHYAEARETKMREFPGAPTHGYALSISVVISGWVGGVVAEPKAPKLEGVSESVDRLLGAEILRVSSERIEDSINWINCVRKLYDACAKQLKGNDVPLTDAMLNDHLPRYVFDATFSESWAFIDTEDRVVDRTFGALHLDALKRAKRKKRQPVLRGATIARSAMPQALKTWLWPGPLEQIREELKGRIVFWEAEGITQSPSSGGSNDELHSGQFGHGKKFGRPPNIPNERKAAALEKKQGGGSNKDAACLIYDTGYPSPQQVKNIGSILRHYQKGLKKSVPSGTQRPTTSRNSNKKTGLKKSRLFRY